MQLAPPTPDNKVPQRRPKANPIVVLTSEAHKFLGGTPDELARKDRKRKASGRYSGDTFDTTPDDTASDRESTPRKRELRFSLSSLLGDTERMTETAFCLQPHVLQ